MDQRLALVTELEKELQDVLREIDSREHQPRLLNPEVKLPASILATHDVSEPHTNAAIKDFLTQTLRTAGPKRLDDLVNLARNSGGKFGNKSASRVIHFDLLNLKNSGVLEREDDSWRFQKSP